MNDQAFSWGPFLADLSVAIVGSLVAIVGALWIANRTFRQEVEKERADRAAEDKQRRDDRDKERRETEHQVLISLLAEFH